MVPAVGELGMATGQVRWRWIKNPPLTTLAMATPVINETRGCNVIPGPTFAGLGSPVSVLISG